MSSFDPFRESQDGVSDTETVDIGNRQPETPAESENGSNAEHGDDKWNQLDNDQPDEKPPWKEVPVKTAEDTYKQSGDDIGRPAELGKDKEADKAYEKKVRTTIENGSTTLRTRL